MQFTRFLRNELVTVAEMAAFAAAGTAARVKGRDIVAVQDTSEVALGGRRAREQGYGPIGKGGAVRGLLVHPVLAVEAGTGALLGLVDVQVWNRQGGKVAARRQRATAAKESQCWLDGAMRAGEVLSAAARITVVADRESDIYEQFARCPANVDLIVRAAQNRRLGPADDPDSGLLFEFADALPEQDRIAVAIPAAPGRKARTAELALRYAPVDLRKPRHGAAGDLPATVTLTLVDVSETGQPENGEPVHWRLLTTCPVNTTEQVRRIIGLYRQRWTIEEFFRTLKTAGFDIERADIGDPRAMINFTAAATVAAVTVLQLVQARDGTTGQLLSDALDPADQPIIEALSTKLEGKTARQKNPHPKETLAFAAWVMARLGGWDGYYGKPGPQVMRRGLDDFRRIKLGTELFPRFRDV